MNYFNVLLLQLLNNNIWTEFVNYQTFYNKSYSKDEFLERFNNYKNNAKYINSHNSNPDKTFTMAINAFSDLSVYEFKERYIGKTYLSETDYGCLPMNYSYSYSDIETFDWRTYNVVNPVKDQGQCGSCWAFATTANAESAWAIYTGKLYDLSEQYLVDCAIGKEYLNMGCQGGNMDSAFKFMINERQCTSTEYPYVSGYTERKGACHSCDELTNFMTCYDVEPLNQLALKEAVLRGPVVIGIEADTYTFQSYSSGIITSPLCGTDIDHAVEIVGFGVDNDTPYWTVRNSWGPGWGEDGYFRILRTDETNDPGICGLAIEPSFITV
jgi:C1A family cysteine protease